MASQSEIRLIVGLGNPGQEYEQTRHNAGFWFVDRLAIQYGSGSLTKESKFKGWTGSCVIGGKTIRLLKPDTFMNLSGQSVAALANFFKIDCNEILVAHDELDIDPGTVRLKMGGGHGGHNGLRDIVDAMGNRKDFGRLRIGIGHPGKASQVSNFVLKKASIKEQDYIDQALFECIKHVENIVSGAWQPAMNELHGFNADPEARAREEAKKAEKERKKQERAAQRAAAKAEPITQQTEPANKQAPSNPEKS